MPKNTAEVTAANVLDAVFDTWEGGATYQVDVAGAIVDQLLGSDPHALVRSIAGVPEDLVEVITDGIVNTLKAQVAKRLGAPSTE